MEYRVAHILVSHDQIIDIIANRPKDEALSIIEDALDRIQDGSSFESIASQVSDCPSGAMGGLLGVINKGEMVPEFEEVAFSLSEGEVSSVFETEYGYHLAWRYNDELLSDAFQNAL